jgi:hypothetical protein
VDLSVPELRRRGELLARIRDERGRAQAYLLGQHPEERRFVEEARALLNRALVVLGSARSGTSVLKAVLARAGRAVSLPGEHRLLFTLLGLNFPDHGVPTECQEEGELAEDQREFVLSNLCYDCRGEEARELSATELERYGWEWALQFRLQWPELDVPLEDLVRAVVEAWARVPATGPRGDRVTLEALHRLRAGGVPVDPHYYDLPAAMIRERFAGSSPTRRPPSGTTVEITPFRVVRPTRRPRVDAGSTLVLKASSDAYRIPLVRGLFRGWHVRELFLTRNPLASVNGLLDGWLHHCFWQHDLGRAGLDVPEDPELGHPRGWWKFDLHDTWEEDLARPLTDLCAGQWRSANERIRRLEDVSRKLRVRFEDFQDADRRRQVLERIVSECGLCWSPALERAAERPPLVNVTTAPAPARWRRQRPWLLETVRTAPVVRTAAQLGYDWTGAATWT